MWKYEVCSTERSTVWKCSQYDSMKICQEILCAIEPNYENFLRFFIHLFISLSSLFISSLLFSVFHTCSLILCDLLILFTIFFPPVTCIFIFLVLSLKPHFLGPAQLPPTELSLLSLRYTALQNYIKLFEWGGNSSRLV